MLYGKESMKLSEIIKKIISVLFPEFTNKLTWTVVAAGLTLVSSSFLELIIRTFVNESFSWNLTDGNDAIIGVTIIALGLLHNYGFVREKHKAQHDPMEYEKLNRELDHDKTVFNELDKYISENHLKNYINYVMRNHSYYSVEDEPLDYFFYEGDKAKYSFIKPKVNTAKSELHDAFVKFENFKSKCFFSHGPARNDGKLYMCMHPDWNIDRGGHPSIEERNEYDKLTRQLITLGKIVIEKYDNYRLAVISEYAI